MGTRARTGQASLLILLLVVLLVGPVLPDAEARDASSFEVWALDQGEGENRIYVYDGRLRRTARIDLGGVADTPHMIDFDARERYAFVANTRSGNVAIIDAARKRLVEVIATGATAHMAAVTPDDSAVWVANIGSRTLSRIDIDTEAGLFTLDEPSSIDLASDPVYQEIYGDWEAPPGPVCHSYTGDGRYAYVTLGPSEGGLVVVDLEAGKIVKAFDPAEVKANCGTALSPDGSRMYANWGSPSHEEGELYAFDVDGHELVATIPTRGVDAHGVRFRPGAGGKDELWLVNRLSDNAIVIDPATNEVTRELDFVGASPDILDFSPDGQQAFVTLRGPNPRSGAHAVAGDTPGFAVLDAQSGAVERVVRPAGNRPSADFHGIAVRTGQAGPGQDRPPFRGKPEWVTAPSRAFACHLS